MNEAHFFIIKLTFVGKIPDIKQANLKAVLSFHPNVFLETALQGII